MSTHYKNVHSSKFNDNILNYNFLFFYKNLYCINMPQRQFTPYTVEY